jgi:hypothetical protein
MVRDAEAVELLTVGKVRDMLPLVRRIGRDMQSVYAGMAKELRRYALHTCRVPVDPPWVDSDIEAGVMATLHRELRRYSDELGELGGRVLEVEPIAFGFKSVRGGDEGVVFWRLDSPKRVEFLTDDELIAKFAEGVDHG